MQAPFPSRRSATSADVDPLPSQEENDVRRPPRQRAYLVVGLLNCAVNLLRWFGVDPGDLWPWR
jgi:hypothetical protein